MTDITRSSRIATRRWAAKESRSAITEFVSLLENDTFYLNQAAAQCYRLLTASAATLALEDDDKVIASACFETADFHRQLYEGQLRSDHADFAAGFSRVTLAYVLFARKSLHLTYPTELLDAVSQILERQAVLYLEADPDIHWNILTRSCWSLYDCVAAHSTPQEVESLIQSIEYEIHRIAGVDHDQIELDLADIAKRSAPVSYETIPDMNLEKGKGRPLPFDDRPRYERLIARHEALLGAGIPDLAEYKRVGTELNHIANDRAANGLVDSNAQANLPF